MAEKPMSDERREEMRAVASPGGLVHSERLDECVREIDRLRAEHQAEVDEFNAGYNAAVAGLPDEEPSDTKYDQWRVGYAWASFDRLWETDAALAKTADGVSIVPGMRVWPRGDCFLDDEQGAVVKLILWDDLCGEVELNAVDCYSTEAAAIEAQKAQTTD